MKNLQLALCLFVLSGCKRKKQPGPFHKLNSFKRVVTTHQHGQSFADDQDIFFSALRASETDSLDQGLPRATATISKSPVFLSNCGGNGRLTVGQMMLPKFRPVLFGSIGIDEAQANGSFLLQKRCT